MARVLLQDAAMRRVAGMGRQAGLCIKELLMYVDECSHAPCSYLLQSCGTKISQVPVARPSKVGETLSYRIWIHSVLHEVSCPCFVAICNCANCALDLG
jgi:hypothetical protein